MSGTARAEDRMGANENLAVHVRWAGAEDRHDLSRHSEFPGVAVIIQQLG